MTPHTHPRNRRNALDDPITAASRAVIQSCYDAWIARDIDALLATLSDDAVYSIHVAPDEILPLAGAARGKRDIRQRLALILGNFEFLAYVVERLTVDGETGRGSVVFYYRHIATGEDLNGRFRHIWRVKHGRIVEVDEFHDAAMINAFMRMVEARGHAGLALLES